MDVGTVHRSPQPQEQPHVKQGRQPAAVPFAREQAQALKRTDTIAAGAQAEPREVVTDEERAYFEQLFPAASAEIRSHPTYTPAGLRSTAVPGMMIDRKG